MSTPATKMQDVAAEWRAARRVYPIYAAVLKRFDLGMLPCKELESPIDRADADYMAAMREWLLQMDERCTAMHLRQILQTHPIGTEENLRALLQRFLNAADDLERFREKVDFLLVQYFSQAASMELFRSAVRLEDVAQVLEPVIGEASLRIPGFMSGLEMLLVRIEQCKSLTDLLKEGILEQGRAIKQQAGPMYFGSGVMLGFTRYNFLIRRGCLRLLQEDLKRIRGMLKELEARGVRSVDCTGTERGTTETTADLRRICRDWHSVHAAAYQEGNPFKALVDIGKAVEAALAAAPEIAKPAPKLEITVEEEELGPEDHMDVVVDSGTVAAAPVVEAKSTPISAPVPSQPLPVSSHPVQSQPLKVQAVQPQPLKSQPRTPQPVKASPKSSAPQSVPIRLQTAVEEIAGQLLAGELENKHLPVSTIKLGETNVLLSSWEVAAFIKGGHEMSDVLQRAVALRALLFECLERARKTKATEELATVLKLSHGEAAGLQETIAQARDRKDIDTALNMAATAKRLLTLIDEGEQWVAKGVAGEKRN